jgi:hypothetical protein
MVAMDEQRVGDPRLVSLRDILGRLHPVLASWCSGCHCWSPPHVAAGPIHFTTTIAASVPPPMGRDMGPKCCSGLPICSQLSSFTEPLRRIRNPPARSWLFSRSYVHRRLVGGDGLEPPTLSV